MVLSNLNHILLILCVLYQKWLLEARMGSYPKVCEHNAQNNIANVVHAFVNATHAFVYVMYAFVYAMCAFVNDKNERKPWSFVI